MITDEEKKKLSRKNYMCTYWHTAKGKARRKELRQAYYDKTKHLSSGKGRRWSKSEVETLLTFTGKDEELAYTIGRSVKAIQMKRLRIKEETRCV